MRAHLRWVALACFLLGCAVMVPFDGPLPRIVGMSLLVAFIALGTYLIASPERLGQGGDEP